MSRALYQITVWRTGHLVAASGGDELRRGLLRRPSRDFPDESHFWQEELEHLQHEFKTKRRGPFTLATDENAIAADEPSIGERAVIGLPPRAGQLAQRSWLSPRGQ